MKLNYRKKTCTSCHRYLYLGQYYKCTVSKNHPDGYDCRCKECRRKEKREEYARTRKKPDGYFLNRRGQPVLHSGNSVRITWGPTRTHDFKRMFPSMTNQDLAVEFGCSVRTVVRRAREWDLHKNPVWLKSKWDDNRRLAHAVNKVCGVKFNYEQLKQAGMPYRFKSKSKPNII